MKNECKGYVVPAGYIGYVDGKKMLFATEDDYIEYVKEKERINEIMSIDNLIKMNKYNNNRRKMLIKAYNDVEKAFEDYVIKVMGH